MAAVKSVQESAAKWTRRASIAGADYQKGVEAPRASWAQQSLAAGNNYRQGVTAAANAGRFESGVRAAGDERWREGATRLGASRFAEGVQAAMGRWEQGFAPYHGALSALTLPARGPAGSPANLTRVAAVATALRGVKERAGK